MRVVGGRLKGRNLASPSSRDIRPTADRLRESVFNILVHAYDDPIADARVLRDQLGDKVIEKSGAQFDVPQKSSSGEGDASGEKKTSKRDVIADRKGRRVLVQRTGSEEARARNEDEANGYGPPRRPQRGYHGKRDLAPKED